MQRKVFSVAPHATAAEALGLMDEHDIRILPVLDEAQRCQGMLSLFKLSKFLFPGANRPFDSRRVLSSLRVLAQTLGGKMLVAHEADQEENSNPHDWRDGIGNLCRTIGAISEGKTARRRWGPLGHPEPDRERVRAMIVTGGMPLEPKTIEAARGHRV